MPDDIQLEQLLTQLLRAVFPALGAGRPEARATSGQTGRPTGGPAIDQAPGSAASNAAMPAPGLPKEYGVAVADPNSRPASGEPAMPQPSVSASEARALLELMSARGIAQGELASLLGLDKSTVSRLAASLERKGWVRRGRDEDNQRYVRLYLTQQGREVGSRVWHTWQSRQARVLAGLSPAERAGLSAGLRGLVRGLAAEGLLGDRPEPPSAG